jgi:hypothetical protein
MKWMDTDAYGRYQVMKNQFYTFIKISTILSFITSLLHPYAGLSKEPAK